MRRRRLGRLQARLLLWFLGAILLAIAASVVTTVLTASELSETPTRVVSRHVQQRLAQIWDDPRATDAYVAELRDTTGLDLRVRRDPSLALGRRGRRGNGMIFEDGVAYVPIARRGQPLGALEIRTGAPPPRLWRVVVALGAAVLVLGAMARRVSKRIARPLEHLAHTAERFGSGDLGARVGVDELPRRWVAEEVRDVGRAFDGMAGRIARVVTEQRELLAAISHELRSPLGRARVALEIARERTESDEAATRSLAEVDKQLVEVDAILGDLLASARAGLADLRLEEVDLGEWLRARASAESVGPIDVESADGAAPGAGPKAQIDPGLLGRAVHNLFANAWAHGHPKTEPLAVSLAASTSPDEVVITVRDRGPGFPEDVLPRAFEPFVTGGSSARSPGQGGIGLGLALVRRIVDAHGGRATARNVRDDAGRVAGAEVEVRVPRRQEVGGARSGPIRSRS